MQNYTIFQIGKAFFQISEEMSQIEETREFYNLRAGMGLSYIQIGIPKRIFVVSEEVEKGKFERHVVINPKIKS